MKLEDHLTEYGMSEGPVNETPHAYHILHEDVKDLYVAGSCDKCEYRESCAMYDILEMGGYSQENLKGFGCIHWEKKK